jgi:phosphatidylglycerol:prolipoprotein diacylglycerol transferase
VHPIALKFGALTVTWYGVMVALAFVAGLWTASRRAPSGGFSPESILDLGPWIIVGAILGARALYVITFWREQFSEAPFFEVFRVWRGGLVFYGGFAGAVVTCIVWARLKSVAVWNLGDVLAPSIALGYAFGRMGCLLNGCCYGKACALPWAIHFPIGHESGAEAVHPTQVYDALAALAFYAFLAWRFRRRTFPGQVFVTYLWGYAILRFSVEFLRGDYPPEQHYLGGWATPAQVASLLILLAGVLLWFLLPRPAQPGPGDPGMAAGKTAEAAGKRR